MPMPDHCEAPTVLVPAATGGVTFHYHRSLTPIIGTVLALALVETIVLHIVAAAYWGWRVALVLGLMDRSLVATLARLLISFRHRPIMLQPPILTMSTGHRLTIVIPTTDIVGFRDHWNANDVKHRETLNMALASWPNVMIDLSSPLTLRRRSVSSIAHCVDDPVAFRAAVTQAMI